MKLQPKPAQGMDYVSFRTFRAAAVSGLTAKYACALNEVAATDDGFNLYKVLPENLVRGKAVLSVAIEEQQGQVLSGAYGIRDGDGAGWLCGVFTALPARGRGYASQCIRNVLDALRMARTTTVYLTMRPGSAAHALYKDIGFSDVCLKKVIITGSFEDGHLVKFRDGQDQDGHSWFLSQVMVRDLKLPPF
jgi:GNAT superfamily N-acetyltransferase